MSKLVKARNVNIVDKPIKIGDFKQAENDIPEVSLTETEGDFSIERFASENYTDHAYDKVVHAMSEKTLEEAKQEAEQIIASARQEAESIIERAKSEAQGHSTEVYNSSRDQGYNAGYSEGAEAANALKSQAEEILSMIRQNYIIIFSFSEIKICLSGIITCPTSGKTIIHHFFVDTIEEVISKYKNFIR